MFPEISHARQGSDLRRASDWQKSLRSQNGTKKILTPSNAAFLKKGQGFENRTARHMDAAGKRLEKIRSEREKQQRMENIKAAKVEALRIAALKAPNPALKKLALNPKRDPGLPTLTALGRLAKAIRAFFVPLNAPVECVGKKESPLKATTIQGSISRMREEPLPVASHSLPGGERISGASAESAKLKSAGSGNAERHVKRMKTRGERNALAMRRPSPQSMPAPSVSEEVRLRNASPKRESVDSGTDCVADAARGDDDVLSTGMGSHTADLPLPPPPSGTAPESRAGTDPGSASRPPIGEAPGLLRKRPAQVPSGTAPAAKKPAAASGKPAVRWVISDGRYQKASDVAKQGLLAKAASNLPVGNAVEPQRQSRIEALPEKAGMPGMPTFEEVRPHRVKRLIDFFESI